jgi:hypothetical protein
MFVFYKIMWASPVIYYTSEEKRIYDCYEIHDNTGEIRNTTTKQYISSSDGKNTVRVTLFRDRNKGEKVSVARAILSTFVGEPPTKHHTADHINTNHQDNRLENLRWATKSEQSYNQTRNGKRDYKRIPIIVSIDNIEKEYPSISEASRDLGISGGTIHNILNEAFDSSRKFKNIMIKYKEISQDLEDEIWLELEEKPNVYISQHGRVKFIRSRVTIVRSSAEIARERGDNYPVIALYKKKYYIHRLVAKYFIPVADCVYNTDLVVDHLDCDKNNACASNLQWISRSENTRRHWNTVK